MSVETRLPPQEDLRSRALLSLQRALLGEVTQEVLAVSMEISPESLHIWVYHGGMTPEEQEHFDGCAVSQVLADFPYPERGDPAIDSTFVLCGGSGRIVFRGVLAFARSGLSWASASNERPRRDA